MIEGGRKASRTGLGRGLNALLGETLREAPTAQTVEGTGLRSIPVGAIRPHPRQPRRHFSEQALDELAQSIAARGVIQPIVVRPYGRDFQIVAGERRWRAAQRAQLHEIPAIVRELDDAQTAELALVENIQREDLSAIEEATAYRRLIDEYGHTQDALARLVEKSRSHVTNLLRLLDLPEDVQALVADGSMTMGHARALIGAPDPLDLARDVIAKGLSVRETERLAKGVKQRDSQRRPATDTRKDADLAALEAQLADLLGLPVRIVHRGEAGGQVTVGYVTLDQLDLICQRLSGETI